MLWSTSRLINYAFYNLFDNSEAKQHEDLLRVFNINISSAAVIIIRLLRSVQHLQKAYWFCFYHFAGCHLNRISIREKLSRWFEFKLTHTHSNIWAIATAYESSALFFMCVCCFVAEPFELVKLFIYHITQRDAERREPLIRIFILCARRQGHILHTPNIAWEPEPYRNCPMWESRIRKLWEWVGIGEMHYINRHNLIHR